MNITFENYGRFFPVLYFNNAEPIDYYSEGVKPYTLRECMDFINYRMSSNSDCCGAVVCDWDTGEIVATFEYANDDDNDDYDPFCDDECGYDPYEGCYTFDC